MTASSPWTQTVGVVVITGAAFGTTNLRASEPINILGRSAQAIARGPSRLFAESATRDVAMDPAIIFISRGLAQSGSRWYSYVTRRLAELASGKHSYSAIYSGLACDRALELAEKLFDVDTPTPSVVASEEGNVLFIWRSAALELEIEVGPEETAVWAYDRPGGAVWSGQLEDRRANVSSLLASFEQR